MKTKMKRCPQNRKLKYKITTQKERRHNLQQARNSLDYHRSSVQGYRLKDMMRSSGYVLKSTVNIMHLKTYWLYLLYTTQNNS